MPTKLCYSIVYDAGGGYGLFVLSLFLHSLIDGVFLVVSASPKLIGVTLMAVVVFPAVTMVIMSGTATVLQQFISGLKSRNEDTRAKSAKDLQHYVTTELREVPDAAPAPYTCKTVELHPLVFCFSSAKMKPRPSTTS